MTPDNIPIYIITDENDETQFNELPEKSENIKVIVFSRIVHLIDNKIINETELLRKYGKYNFQSLKKYYGIYYLFFIDACDNVITFDSETMIIRDVDINDVINKYVANPFLIYSENNENTKELHIHVNNSTKQILKIENNIGWLLEYYMWIYEKKIFMDFIEYFLMNYEKSVIDILDSYEEVFIEVLFQSFIVRDNKYGYKLININNMMKSLISSCQYDEIICVMEQLKPLEDIRIAIDKGYGEYAKKIYDYLGLNFYKTDNSDKSLKFIMDTENIKICVSEYSNIVFQHYFPKYLMTDTVIFHFVGKNVIETMNISENMNGTTHSSNVPNYIMNKNTSMPEQFHWLGYDVTANDDADVKFSFDLYFSKLEGITNKNFIGFKMHNPEKINIISINDIHVKQWKHYEYNIKMIGGTKDLFILIFDNAPKCNVKINNFVCRVN